MNHPHSPFSSRYLRLTPDGRRDLASRLRAHVDVLAGIIGPRHLGLPPHNHAPSDTLDYPRLAQATLGIAGAIARIGQFK